VALESRDTVLGFHLPFDMAYN